MQLKFEFMKLSESRSRENLLGWVGQSLQTFTVRVVKEKEQSRGGNT